MGENYDMGDLGDVEDIGDLFEWKDKWIDRLSHVMNYCEQFHFELIDWTLILNLNIKLNQKTKFKVQHGIELLLLISVFYFIFLRISLEWFYCLFVYFLLISFCGPYLYFLLISFCGPSE